jgi:serine/threonine-protein kinase HipA
MQRAIVTIYDQPVGWLEETEDGYRFQYDPVYVAGGQAYAVSLTLPLRTAAFHSRTMFPFFDGLIPEGWLLDIAERNFKLNPRDRMGLLIKCCRDCIGAVGVIPINEKGGSVDE